jgi:uncharacterized protein YndB with AHSA1/START domain
MARNEVHISAPREQVYALLSDPRTYGCWVVGSQRIRAADTDWPAPGSSFDHRVGLGPLGLKDHTDVLAARAPELLELCARASPLPPARVRLHLTERDGGTHVVMEEAPANRWLSMLIGPIGHRLLWLRNVEALRRLKALAEGHIPLPAGSLPPREAARD